MSRHLSNASKTLIDTVFSEVHNTNLLVIDAKFPNGVVERHIVKESGAGSETAMILKNPNGEDFENADTRNWKVDHKQLRFRTFEAMIVAPFLVDAISLNGDGTNETWFQVGLGGGTLDTFFADIKPKMDMTSIEHDGAMLNIAQTWFGVKPGPNRRQYQADGSKILEELKAEGKKYDVFYLDASDGDIENPAPPESFLREDIIKDLKSLLKPNGALIVDIAYMGKELKKKRTKKNFGLFWKCFPYCLKLSMEMEFENNVILVCQTKPMREAEYYTMKLADISFFFGLKLTNDLVEITRV